MELGILKTVSARQRWIDEARDFTPWLADNIKELGSAIGLELEVENVEVQCGPYSADILAKNTGTDDYVVIENQLEKTNHDHLGKALTYASILDAKTIIWIATHFTPEHRKTLDWLNDNTSENISFYGVQLELWQIDESNPAVKFNIISKPNEAVIQASRSKANEELSENRQFQLDFWTRFRDKLAKTKRVPSLQSPRSQYWYNVSLGKSHIHLSLTCNTDTSTVSVRVYVSNKISESMWPFLETRKVEIEDQIGHALLWNPNPENIDKVIVLQHHTDFNNDQSIEEALNWLIEYSIRFRDIFSRLVTQQLSRS